MDDQEIKLWCLHHFPFPLPSPNPHKLLLPPPLQLLQPVDIALPSQLSHVVVHEGG